MCTSMWTRLAAVCFIFDLLMAVQLLPLASFFPHSLPWDINHRSLITQWQKSTISPLGDGESDWVRETEQDERKTERGNSKQPQVITFSTSKMITFGLDYRISLIHFTFCLFLISSYLLNPTHITSFPLIFPSFGIYRTSGRKFVGDETGLAPLMTVLANCECSGRN